MQKAFGQVVLRADSGFENHKLMRALARQGVEFSIGVKQSKTVRLTPHRGTDDERLLDIRRTVAEGVSAIAIPTRPKRKRPARRFVAIVLK